MPKKEPIPLATKFFATESGETTPPGNDVGDEFLRAHRARKVEDALDLFAEEPVSSSRAVQATAAVAVAAPPVEAAEPSGAGRTFAWPSEDEEWTPVAHVPSVAAEPNPAVLWMRKGGPIAAIAVVFIMIVLAVGTWIVRDTRTTRAFRQAASEPPPTVPPLTARPLSWAQAAALADQGSEPPASPAAPSAPRATPEINRPAPASDGLAARAEGTHRTATATPAGNAPGSHAADRRTAPPVAAERGKAVPPPRPSSANASLPASPAVARNAQAFSTPEVSASSPEAAGTSEHVGEPAVVPVLHTTSESPLPAAVMAPPAATAVARITISPDEDDVRRVLGRYRAAYSELDPYAAREVWPTVDMKTLSRAFGQLSSQSLEFNQCHVSIAAAAAVATCEGTAWYVPKVGSRAAKTEARRLRFDLHKGDRGWTIDSVSSR